MGSSNGMLVCKLLKAMLAQKSKTCSLKLIIGCRFFSVEAGQRSFPHGSKYFETRCARKDISASGYKQLAQNLKIFVIQRFAFHTAGQQKYTAVLSGNWRNLYGASH
jgi:hypothetical protein